MAGVIGDVRRGYKRKSKDEAAATNPKDGQPLPRRGKRGPDLHIIQAVRGGEVRCPMKWSMLGIETCAQIQERSGERCAEHRCRFFGHRHTFLVEIERVKTDHGTPSRKKKKPIPLEDSSG